MGTVESVEKFLAQLRSINQTYYGITARNLSPEELAKITIPSRYLNAIRVSLVSRASMSYGASHIAKHPHGPYILLRSVNGSDKENFKEVEEVVSEITGGTPEGNISPDFTGNISDVIRLKRVPTTKLVATYVEKYSTLLERVTVPFVFYSKVPHQFYDNACVPFSKLTIDEPIQLRGPLAT